MRRLLLSTGISLAAGAALLERGKVPHLRNYSDTRKVLSFLLSATIYRTLLERALAHSCLP